MTKKKEKVGPKPSSITNGRPIMVLNSSSGATAAYGPQILTPVFPAPIQTGWSTAGEQNVVPPHSYNLPPPPPMYCVNYNTNIYPSNAPLQQFSYRGCSSQPVSMRPPQQLMSISFPAQHYATVPPPPLQPPPPPPSKPPPPPLHPPQPLPSPVGFDGQNYILPMPTQLPDACQYDHPPSLLSVSFSNDVHVAEVTPSPTIQSHVRSETVTTIKRPKSSGKEDKLQNRSNQTKFTGESVSTSPPDSRQTSYGKIHSCRTVGNLDLGGSPPSFLELQHISVVGSKHAARLALALESLLPNLTVRHVRFDEWTPTAVKQTAETLRRLGGDGSLHIFWLHDDAALVQEDGGPFSTEVGVSSHQQKHCSGRLTVVSAAQMKQICEFLCPIFQVSSDSALSSVLLTPLPSYLSAPCCPRPDHCVGWDDRLVGERLCTALTWLWDAVDRWVDAADIFNRSQVRVLCPHRELLDQLPASSEQLGYLRRLYALDGLHLSRVAYAHLADRIWTLARRSLVLNGQANKAERRPRRPSRPSRWASVTV